MYTDLKGKTAFVMGAGKARGIGFHIAGALARQGVSVCLADRDERVFERARELEAEGVVARAFTADVCSAAQVEAMRDAVGRLFPSIDILIQCAGVFPDPVKLTEDSIETWLHTQDINVHGPGPVESEMVDSRVAAESERLGVPAETLREAIRKNIPLGRMASVDDIVRTALFLASDVSSYLTGQSLNLSGGMITEV